jgi:hypothetical protein
MIPIRSLTLAVLKERILSNITSIACLLVMLMLFSSAMKTQSHADEVREYARREYIEPARKRGESTVRIVAGDVQRAVKLSNRAALVCQALKSHKFLKENHLVLEKWEGPPSGVSTTVKAVYRLEGEPEQAAKSPDPTGFLKFRGIAKDLFESLGGGEAFIRSEREAWGSGEDR